jgi:Type II secretion system (T2SS), protein M subtype b
MNLVRKLLALALLGICLAPLGWGVNAWLQNEEALRQNIADQHLVLAKLENLAALSFNSNEAAIANERASGYFLGIGTPAVLSAALQANLRSLAQRHNVAILQASELVLQPTEAGLARAGLHLELSGLQSNVIDALSQIEASQQLLFIDNVQLRSGFADARQLPAEPAMLVSFDVWGFAATPPAKETP